MFLQKDDEDVEGNGGGRALNEKACAHKERVTDGLVSVCHALRLNEELLFFICST